ncbi:MAG: uroporphyrinogen-III C-methyltransferase [Planctomycetes bacterium]|nr:uroporphyrinogen-III C-methyltransferase [Planctomycetota bacterium]
MTGKVYIVGAGPGEAGLITVSGLAVLRRANVVLYDRLVSGALLAEVPSAAERISVGKRPGGSSVGQDEINALMEKKAREGHLVVRLKGGDPGIFARAGEEADFLGRRGIDFEIIPGVTTACAAAAAAGVVLTDRRRSSSVMFVTGREGQGGSPGVNWRAAALSGGTLVIYMGRSNLADIAGRLIGEGLSGSTPALVVADATLPSEQMVTGALGEIAGRCDEEGLEAPCVVIVGEVTAKYPADSLLERLPLFGRTIVVTRPVGQAGPTADALSALGARVVRFPTIRIIPAPPERLDRGLGELERADWVVFTSANGVRTFFEALERAGRDSRALFGRRIAAIGMATAEALGSHGICADLVPGEFTSEALFGELAGASRPGEVFILWRSAAADRGAAFEDFRTGREVIEVAAYDAASVTADAADVRALVDKAPSAVLFASARTAQSFVSIIGCDAAREMLRAGLRCVSIGPVTSQALRALGLPQDAEAEPHTSEGLVCATLNVLAGDSETQREGG